VLLSHGYGDNQIQMLPYADFLLRQGFSVLT
jgi:predicted esterase